MKGLLIILIVVGLLILTALACVLAPNLLSPAAPARPEPPQGAGSGSATPTPAAAQPIAPTAAPIATLPPAGAAFNGTFAGTFTSDDGSSAPLSVVLSQNGTAVAGDIAIGQGLTIDGGNCGVQAIPSGTRAISGQADPANPNHIEATTAFDAQGLTVTVQFVADVSADGNTLTSAVRILLPFLCGREPVLSGTLARR